MGIDMNKRSAKNIYINLINMKQNNCANGENYFSY